MNAFFYRFRLRKNEHGFILPLTLIIVFLLFGFLLHEIKVYETQKQFVHHEEGMLILDRLLQSAATDIEAIPYKKWPDTFSYPAGVVEYKVKKLSKGSSYNTKKVVSVTLTAKRSKDQNKYGTRHISYVYYHKDKDKIVRWMETVRKK